MKRDSNVGFSSELCEIFKKTFLTEHVRKTGSCVYLCILRNFSEYLFYRTPLGDLEGVHLIKIPDNYLWRSQFVVKLGEANRQVYKKNFFSLILLCVFCLYFLRTHHDYFFRRGFEFVQALFLSGNINETIVTFILPVQLRFIYVNFLHVKYGTGRCLKYSFLSNK